MKTVVGIFQSREQAQAAASRLHEAGFAAEQFRELRAQRRSARG